MLEDETLQMDEVLEKITFYCLGQTREALEQGDEPAPFSVIVEGEQLFVETYEDADVVSCRANAQANVKSSSTFSTHYAFCYDGFLMTDEGQLDAIIVECAQRDMQQAHAIALLYTRDADGALVFEDVPVLVDEVETFYDREAVLVAEAQQAAEDDGEMLDAQEALERALGTREGTSDTGA